MRIVTFHVLLAGLPSASWSKDLGNTGACDLSGSLPEERGESFLQRAAIASGNGSLVVEDAEPLELSNNIRSESASGLFVAFDKNGLQKTIKVLGMQHTGTHLLHEVLSNGFGLPSDSHEPITLSPDDCGFWKHAFLSNLWKKAPEHFNGCKEGVVGLAMVRNPLAWLEAVRRAPFEMEPCFNSENWTTRPCRFSNTDQIVRSLQADVALPNVAEAWTLWSKDYESLEGFPFAQGLLLRYEDLVRDPDGVVRELAVRANLTVAASWHEHAVQDQETLSTRREEIRSRRYLRRYTAEELRQVCERLDLPLMRRHGYDDCDEILQLQG